MVRSDVNPQRLEQARAADLLWQHHGYAAARTDAERVERLEELEALNEAGFGNSEDLGRMREALVKYRILDRRKRAWCERHGEPYTGLSTTVFEIFETYRESVEHETA